MAQFFFPSNLSPQGWLTDFLLAQAYDKSHGITGQGVPKSLKDFLYDGEFKMMRDLKGQVFSLHPADKNILEMDVLPAMLTDPSSSDTKNDADQKKYHEFMRTIQPGAIAALQPYIRLYLKSKKTGKERDIKFKTHTDLDVLLSNRFARGEGAGIKQVSVARNYSTFGLTNSFNTTIEYFFRSMAIFSRGASDDKEFRDDYVRLVAPPGLLDKRGESLYLEYGWSVGKNVSKDIIPNDIKQILEVQERKKRKLSWKKSDFKFEQTGEVLLTVQYTEGPYSELRKDSSSTKDNRTNNVLQITDSTFFDSLYSRKQFDEIRNVHLSLDAAEREVIKLQEVPSEKQRKEDWCAQQAITDEKDQERNEKIKANKNKSKKKKLENLNKKVTKLRAQVAKNAFSSILTSIGKDEQLFKVHFKAERKENLHTVKTTVQRHLDFSDRLEFVSSFELNKVAKQLEDRVGLSPEAQKKLNDSFNTVGNTEQERTDADNARSSAFTDAQYERMLSALCNSDFGTNYPKKSFGNIMFFPLRALIAAVFKSVDAKHRKELPFICLGNVAYRSLGRTLWANIGDVLIEVGTFQRWFFNATFRQGLSEWRMNDFLEAVMKDLVLEALHDHSTGDSGHTNFGPLKREEYTLPESWLKGRSSHGKWHLTGAGKTGLLDQLRTETDKNLRFINLFLMAKDIKRKSMAKEKDIGLLYYHQVGSSQQSYNEIVSPLMRNLGDAAFNRAEDEAKGRIHLNIGDSAGLLKMVQFTEIDNPGLRSAMIHMKNKDSAISFLKLAWRANAVLIGNNLLTKAGWFVLPLNPLGITEEEDPGIVGYYWIHSFVDIISPGDYTTTVKGINQLSNQQIINRRKKKNVSNGCSDVSAEDRKAAIENTKIETYPVVLEHNIAEYIIDLLLDPDISKAYQLQVKE